MARLYAALRTLFLCLWFNIARLTFTHTEPANQYTKYEGQICEHILSILAGNLVVSAFRIACIHI